ncbi:hypothetical protein MXE68_24750 [Escherichia coli]|uniref:hypothetical protein n=1 Tax=Escherichia whittamii TaxID=2762229 RepID=UPI002DBD39B1|nr:hypothetical protein [Escherichia whittamii]EJE7985913.1 hypothetical protein [Escherichia coli]MEB5813675.1 hypothetical protein [Escherichia coli]MEB7938695.1 hypothetical protein [Escherichia whittamii]
MKISTGMMKSNAPLIILICLMIACSAYVKSWSLLYTLLAASVSLTVMISLPFIVSPLQHSKFIALRILRLLVITLWTIGLVGVFFSVVERLVWVNADSYPAWLAKELDSPAITDGENFIKATESFEKICGKNKGYLSVVTKHNGIFMRCDDSLSFDSWWKGVYRLKTPETR